MAQSSKIKPESVLRDLKRIALQGGERGPMYDKGVLAVIEQIERDGSFTPDPAKLIYGVAIAQQLGANILTPEALARVDEMLKERGWTMEQGAEYAAGVEAAERLLAPYRQVRSDT